MHQSKWKWVNICLFVAVVNLEIIDSCTLNKYLTRNPCSSSTQSLKNYIMSLDCILQDCNINLGIHFSRSHDFAYKSLFSQMADVDFQCNIKKTNSSANIQPGASFVNRIENLTKNGDHYIDCRSKLYEKPLHQYRQDDLKTSRGQRQSYLDYICA